MKDGEQIVLIGLALWLANKYAFSVAPALQQGGATLYDALHDDAGHKNDLPGHQLTRARVLAIATKQGFPNPKLASAIAFAESGGVPNAVLRNDREYSVGLWQINTRVHPYSPADMSDPVKNAWVAYVISKAGTDWSPWSTFKNGSYKKFLTGVFA